MTKEKLSELYISICKNATGRKLKLAMEQLQTIAQEVKTGDFNSKLNRHIDIYKYLLKYNIEGIDDPQQEKILKDLTRNVLAMADEAYNFIYLNTHEIYSFEDKLLKKEAALIRPENYADFHAFLRAHNIEEVNYTEKKETLLNKYFIHFWMSDIYTEAQINYYKEICRDESVFYIDKSVLISALTLSFLRYFDSQKMHLLLEFYEKQEDQVWQRALVGLLLGMDKYDKRMRLHNDVIARIESQTDFSHFETAVKAVALQLIRAKETEGITKKIREEILPHVAKITPKIIEKLDLDNIVGENLSEDKNPEWENIFEDSPDLLEKMGELSQMQIEGSDVFMGTFAMLKDFDFFNNFSNWFLPFYKNNSIATNMLAGEEKFSGDKFVNTLVDVPFLCNSDKYSFCLNIIKLPEAQKTMLANLFMAELHDMNDIAKDDKLLRKDSANRYIFTQYIQDLYRFFKLHKHKEHISDVFQTELDIYKTWFYKSLIKNEKILRDIGEFYFNQNHYSNALDVYKQIDENGGGDYEAYQKMAFCYQKLKDYVNALEYYQKAELFDKNKAWNLKKIAFCYQKLQQPDKAAEFYLQVEKIEPDNLQVQANLGRCYLALGDFEKALKYYFKVEYLAPSNIKVQRPLAWCSFVLGKFGQTERYLKKVVEKEGNHHDYLNLGHVMLCSGNKTEAVKYYLKSIEMNESSFDAFYDEFNNDSEYIIKHGIKADDIALLLDFIRFELK